MKVLLRIAGRPNHMKIWYFWEEGQPFCYREISVLILEIRVSIPRHFNLDFETKRLFLGRLNRSVTKKKSP